MSDTQEMTRKEALAILHKMYAAVGHHLFMDTASQDMKMLREQVWGALRLLDTALHGKAPSNCSSELCEVCYLHYVRTSSPWVFLKSKPASPLDCCDTCLQRLRTEGQIERLENWETGEVIAC